MSGKRKSAAVKKGAAAAKPVIKWTDARRLTIEGKGWGDTTSFYHRLPARAKGKVTDPVWDLAQHTSGICVRFVTDAAAVDVRWSVLNKGLEMHHMPSTGVSGVDLYSKARDGSWQWQMNGFERPMKFPANSASLPLQPGKWVEHLLYLPLYNGVTSIEIGVPKGASLAPAPQRPVSRRKPIVFYGTSITQGGCASRPGLSYTAIVGRRLDRPVINLGFSGSGRMEPIMSELIAELDPRVFVLDTLWNITVEEAGERIEPFIKTLRAARPKTPILIAEDCHIRGLRPTPKGVALRKILKKLAAEGIKGVHFLDNKGMMDKDEEGTVDGCHPNDIGFVCLADAFTPKLAAILGK